jgi:UDP-glucuronate decarboxylase
MGMASAPCTDMRVLVTGAASLVGARLCELLLEQGHDVIAVDDFSSGSWANLVQLDHERGFTFVEHDLAMPLSMAADAVFHLAVPSSHRIVSRDPAGAAVTCVAATKHALELAVGKRFVMATSFELAGPGARCAEVMATDLGGDVRVVRMPTTFGPTMDPDDRHPVASLVLRALAGERLAGEDTSIPLRVAYVDDAAHALARAMEEDACGLRIAAPYDAVTAGELSAMIAEVSYDPCRAEDFRMPHARIASDEGCVPAAQVLGLEPSFELREAIGITVSAFETRVGKRGERTSGVFVKDRTAVRAPRSAGVRRRAGAL